MFKIYSKLPKSGSRTLHLSKGAPPLYWKFKVYQILHRIFKLLRLTSALFLQTIEWMLLGCISIFANLANHQNHILYHIDEPYSIKVSDR